MNPLTNIKNVKKLSEQDLKLGAKSSWHNQYKDSAWIFIGGLPFGLTEGDVICVFSQYGEVVNINMVRDKDTGKIKGYCFLCYEDQRSTILAVDNLNGIKILGRTIRVDHVQDYKAPKDSKKNPVDEDTAKIREEGCAPVPISKQTPDMKQEEGIVVGGVKLPPRLPIRRQDDQDKAEGERKKEKSKKKKKEKKSKKKKRQRSSSESSDSSTDGENNVKHKRH